VFSKLRDRLGGNLRLIGGGGAAASLPVLHFFEDIGVSVTEGYDDGDDGDDDESVDEFVVDDEDECDEYDEGDDGDDHDHDHDLAIYDDEQVRTQ